MEVLSMTTQSQTLWRQPENNLFVDAPCSETVVHGAETLYPLRSSDGALAIEICLAKNALLRLAGDHRGERVSCLSGVAWITQPGDPQDILVSAGETFAIAQKGAILVEGLAEARIKINSR
jgi:hypothetical protein